MTDFEAILARQEQRYVTLLKQQEEKYLAIIAQKDKEFEDYKAEQKVLVDGLQEQVKSLKQKLYGTTSEKLSRSQNDKKNPKEPIDPKDTKKKRKEEKEKKQDLEVEEKELQPEPEQFQCDYCDDTEFKKIGEKHSEQIEYVPAKIKRIKTCRHTYQCSCKKTIISAKAPANVRGGVQYGPRFHAHVIVSKILDALPLERQSKLFTRQGCRIAPSTLCDMFHRGCSELDPIANGCKEKVRNSEDVFADETTSRIQPQGVPEKPSKAKKKNRRRAVRPCIKGYMWVFLSKEAFYYTFSLSRSGEIVREVLENTTGTLLTDGYAGYNSVSVDKDKEATENRRVRAGCNSHARRKFFDTSIDEKAADWFLRQYQKIYAVESEASLKGILGSEEHLKWRQEKSKPLMDQILSRATKLIEDELYDPSSLMGKALGFLKKQWQRLTLFLEDATLPLDNNVSERSLRLLAIARKNFLFVGNVKAGESIATALTVIQTCLLYDVDPEEYISDILIRIQTHPNKRRDEIMPWNWKKFKERLDTS